MRPSGVLLAVVAPAFAVAPCAAYFDIPGRVLMCPGWCCHPADEAMGEDISLQSLQHVHPQVQILQQAEQALGSPLSPGGVKPMSIDPPFIVAAQQDDVQTADAGLQLAESMSIDSSHAAQLQWLQQTQLGATAAAPGFAGTTQVQSAQAALTKVAEDQPSSGDTPSASPLQCGIMVTCRVCFALQNALGSTTVSPDHLQADVLLTTGGLKSMQEIDVEQSINADLRSARSAVGPQ